MFKAVTTFVFLICILSFCLAWAEESSDSDTLKFKANENPTLEILRAAGPIVIDAEFDDPG